MSVTYTVEQELDLILSEPVSSAIDREQTRLDQLLNESGGRIVLFGAGNLGRRALAVLRSIGVEPRAFSDNASQVWNTEVEGVPVLPPAIAAGRFGSDSLFLVTIWKPDHWFSETERQLHGLGCRFVSPPSPLYWKFSDTFLPFYAQDLPSKLLKHAPDIVRAGSIWADEYSELEYLRQVRWRSHGEWNFSGSNCEESYFPDSIFRLIPGESFVDCGAFDGDTIRCVLSRQPKFGRILAVEPDGLTFAKLESFVESLPPDVGRKISLHHCAVGETRGVVQFTDTGSLGSRPSAEGTTSVLCLPISEIAEGTSPITYIKMDIEGAEPDALSGARSVIERDRPVLSICVYHEQDHLWKIPLLMKQLVPEYQMYLRCHEGDGWQTVAYAVPKGRALGISRSDRMQVHKAGMIHKAGQN